MTTKEIEARLIRTVEADNGMRPGSILNRLIPDKKSELTALLEQGIAFMLISGCEFSPEEIELTQRPL